MRENLQKKINRVEPKLTAYAQYLTTSKAEAADLYQDTILRILRNINKYKEGSNFQAWAITIMRNIFINGYRKKVRNIIINDHTDNGFYINSQQNVFNEGIDLLAFGEILRLVNKLSDNFKIPFWMIYQGYKYEEVAETLDIPLGTVKSRVFFARQKLQTMCKASNIVST